MTDRKQADAKSEALLAAELELQEKTYLARQRALDRASAERRAALFSLLGALLGAGIGHFLVSGVSYPALVGMLVGALVGRLQSRVTARHAG